MQHNYKKTISKITLTLLATASLASVAYAADLNQNQQPKRNPFTKMNPIAPATLPSGLPNDLPPPNYNQVIGGTASRDLGDTPEAREAKIYWENMKIVGIFNNHILLRIDENDEDNNSIGSNSNSNGSNNNNRNSNNNNSNGNNNTPVTTIMTTIGEKFLINKNYYTIKKEKDSYVVYNRNSQPMHSMILENNSTKLIPRINANGSGTSNGVNSATK